MTMKPTVDDNGAYPAFAWPGGYPLYYLTADNGILCPECANGRHGSEAGDRNTDPQWRLVAVEVHWEGEPLTCDHCQAKIESAYGIPE
jgi:hypothetical protein